MPWFLGNQFEGVAYHDSIRTWGVRGKGGAVFRMKMGLQPRDLDE
jgi:hypothetical protein